MHNLLSPIVIQWTNLRCLFQWLHVACRSLAACISTQKTQTRRNLTHINPKNTKKSPIHENTNAKITCDFGDERFRIAAARLEKDIFVRTYLHTTRIVVRMLLNTSSSWSGAAWINIVCTKCCGCSSSTCANPFAPTTFTTDIPVDSSTDSDHVMALLTMTMTSWCSDTDYHNHDDDDNDWLCIIVLILAGYQLWMST